MSIAVADFNRDGRPDLAIANLFSGSGPGSVSILVANSDGTYQAPVPYLSADVNIRAIVAGEFNHDGNPDVAVADSREILVFLGNGDGTLRVPVSYAVGPGISGSPGLPWDDIYRWGLRSLAIGDFNGDSHADIAFSNGFNGAGVLLGHGNGAFSPPLTFAAGSVYANGVAVGDLNRDGKPDLVVANHCLDSSCLTGAAVVLLGNGDGTFRPGVSYTSGWPAANSVAVGDLNADGIPDLAIANPGGGASYRARAGATSILLGNGDGSFGGPVVYPSELAPWTEPSSVAVADFNRDGKLDVSVMNRCLDWGEEEGTVSIFLGTGTGTLRTPPTMFATVDECSSGMAVADLDLDGNPDVAVSSIFSYAALGGASVLIGNGDGSLHAARRVGSGGDSVSVAVSDLNRDGKADLAVANDCESYGACQRGSIGVLLGKGNGTFQPPRIYYAGSDQINVVATADFNHDGKPDLVFSGRQTSYEIGVLLAEENSGYRLHYVYPTSSVSSFAAEDFNLDGNLDLVIAPGLGAQSGAAVFLGDGTGSFHPPVDYGSRDPYGKSAAAAADLNGDGKPDLIIANPLQVMLGNGDGTFQPVVQYSTPYLQSTERVLIGDFNSDGKPDLVISRFFSALLLPGQGDGTFLPAIPYSGGLTVAADFNGDGTVDMVSGGGTRLDGVGEGVFKNAVRYSMGGSRSEVGDFNSDGKPDLALIAYGTGTVTLWLNVVTGFRHATDTALVSSANPSVLGKPLTFSATVTPAFGRVVTGSITFSDAGLALATISLVGNKATFTTSALSLGVHSITAIYEGDGSHLPSTSTVLQQAVVDRTPPVITISAQPSVLWPPNGKMMPVTVSGRITDMGSGVNTTTAEYAVTDEYRQIQPNGHLTLDSSGNYTFTILFRASLKKNDTNGHRYTIRVSATDQAGNRAANSAVVKVAHTR